MRILYLVTRAHHGGAQSHVLDLARGMLRDDNEVWVAAGERGYLLEKAQSFGCRVAVVPGLTRDVRLASQLDGVRSVNRLLSEVQPSIIHSHTSNAGLIGRIVARARGVPTIYTAHGWQFAPGVPAWHRGASLVAEVAMGRISDRIITVSNFDRRLALRMRVAHADRIVTVHNGVPDRASDIGHRSSGEPRLIMVARFAKQKDHTTLLRSLAGISLPWSLQLVGDGPLLEATRDFANSLGIADRVTFLGARDDVPALLAQSDIFVLASRWEGLPVSIIEAMRAALPVVTTDTGGCDELVEDGECGYLVPVGDETCMRARLTALIGDAGLRERLGRSARASYQANFTDARMLSATDAVYRDVLAVRSAAVPA